MDGSLMRSERLLREKRWRAVHAFQIKELRRMTPLQKFLQLDALMSSGFFKKSPRIKQHEAARARDNWLKLKKLKKVPTNA